MTPAPTRITENMAALCGLEDVWYIAGASLRSRTAVNQRVGRMSDGLLRVFVLLLQYTCLLSFSFCVNFQDELADILKENVVVNC